jgi:hypothetical protein
MNIFDANPENTVGICTDMFSPPQFMGTFTPKYLKEWAEKICKEYGKDVDVKVDLHHCAIGKSCSFLAASADGNEPYVVVVGHEIIPEK